MTHEDTHDHVTDPDCLEAFDNLYAYLDGELTDPEAIARYKHHLSHCRSCFSRHEFETALTERINKSAKDGTPESLRKRLRDLIDEF